MPMSDKEEILIAKSLWKEYGYYILFTILFVLLANFGWHRYQQYRNMRIEQASSTYMHILNLVEQKKPEEVKLFGEKLIKDHAKTIYASLAALILAKEAVNSSDLKLADERLHFVVENSPDKKLRQIARVREARVLVGMKKSQDAINVLATVDDDNYQAEVNEALGDALLDLGKVSEAEEAYRKANSVDDNNKEHQLRSPLIKVKMQQF